VAAVNFFAVFSLCVFAFISIWRRQASMSRVALPEIEKNGLLRQPGDGVC